MATTAALLAVIDLHVRLIPGLPIFSAGVPRPQWATELAVALGGQLTIAVLAGLACFGGLVWCGCKTVITRLVSVAALGALVPVGLAMASLVGQAQTEAVPADIVWITWIRLMGLACVYGLVAIAAWRMAHQRVPPNPAPIGV